MKEEFYIPTNEISRIRESIPDPILATKILADIIRVNTLYMIDKAGSGHIGSSFSSMEIITWLWTQQMINPNQPQLQHSDIYFSSKGHDVPALYSLLIGLGKLDQHYIHQLRQVGGLPGHPDIHTPYIVSNTGALGMGISKARGMAIANRLDDKTGRIYVLTGDGELQEGQFWESLQPTANGRFSEITVIVDHNKLQSDTLVSEVSDLGRLDQKLASFGWAVSRCNGHDPLELRDGLQDLTSTLDKPQILIADTIKGKGVPFLESTNFNSEDRLYKYHSGALSLEDHHIAADYLLNQINSRLETLSLPRLKTVKSKIPNRVTANKPERLIAAYEQQLREVGQKYPEVVVLDADLAKDCGLLSFEKEFPDRFIECGIAEQDMVSLAGGLALRGKLPIVHSFGCFLTTRANEQIYNNSTEETKIIYVGSLAGLLPAAPGHSHQSVRDISLLGSIPNLTLLQPSNEQETKLALKWAINHDQSSYIRLVSIPVEIPYQLPEDYRLQKGIGATIKSGTDAAIISYGPVMLTESYRAALTLESQGLSLAVINLPWLNSIDPEWIESISQEYSNLFTIDDHYEKLGQGQQIAAALSHLPNHARLHRFGIDRIPVSGQNDQALKAHSLDAFTLQSRILSCL